MRTTTEKPTSSLRLFQLTWPIFLELLLFTSIGLADTFMLSSVSDHAVAGVGAANQYIQLAILFIGVIGVGASIIVSQTIGAKRYQDVTKISAAAITINMIVGLLVSGLFFIASTFLLRLLQLEGEVLHYAELYLVIVGSTIFLQALITIFSSLIRVHGLTKKVMYLSIVMNVSNVIGNYILIFGKLGFPALGVEGAAIATVISRIIGVVCYAFLFKRILHERLKLSYFFRISKQTAKQIIAIGLPSAFEKVIYRGYQMMFIVYITFLGAGALAARQYALNLTSFVYLFAIAIGSGTAIIIGRHIGAGEKELARVQVRSSVKWAVIWTTIMALGLIIFRTPVLSLLTNDPAVMSLAATVLIWSLFVDTGGTINIILVNALRATGDATFPVIMGILSMLLIGLPLGYIFIFKFEFGLVGMWVALGVEEWFRAFFMYRRWISGKWEKKILVK